MSKSSERAILEAANELKQLAREFGVKFSSVHKKWVDAHDFLLTEEVTATHDEAVAFLQANNRHEAALQHLRSAYTSADKVSAAVSGECA